MLHGRRVFAEFGALRKPNTDAIAAMALENYLEMRERVVDPKFQLQQALSLELERRFPQRFIPRYSMVMFHHEIPYRTALERGTVQARAAGRIDRGRGIQPRRTSTSNARNVKSAARLAPARTSRSQLTRPDPTRSSVMKL